MLRSARQRTGVITLWGFAIPFLISFKTSRGALHSRIDRPPIMPSVWDCACTSFRGGTTGHLR